MTDAARGHVSGFPKADRAAWRALALRALGAPPDAGEDAGEDAGDDALAPLVRRTFDGVVRGPVATPEDLPPIPPSSDEISLSPGAARAEDNRWLIRSVVAAADPAEAGAQAREELAGGADALELRIDATGAAGVAIGALSDLERTLDGVDLAATPLSLDAGDLGLQAAALFLDYAAARGLDAARLRGALDLDPLGRLAAQGRLERALDAEMTDAAAWATRLAASHPSMTAFRADARVVHEAGGAEAWEIAFAATSALACLKSMVDAGLPLDPAAQRIAFAVALDADVHLGVAKLGALRRVWRRIVTACGGGENAARAPICAYSSDRMITRKDPHTNLIRLAAAGFAAACGGADAIRLAPFTDAPEDAAAARRLSRNLQLIMREEASLAGARDPAAGSFHHEAMAHALARQAWSHVQTVEGAGGLAAFIESGRLRAVVEETRATRLDAVARGDAPIIGVTAYPSRDQPPPAAASPDAPATALTPIRLAEAFEASKP